MTDMVKNRAAADQKIAADRRRRELQAIDAPKARAAYEASIQAVRTRTAQLREQRLAREAAEAAEKAMPAQPRSRSKKASRGKTP